MFQELRDPATGHLLGRYDPERELLELMNRVRKHLVLFDLTEIKQSALERREGSAREYQAKMGVNPVSR